MLTVFDLIEMSVNSTNPGVRHQLDATIGRMGEAELKAMTKDAITLLAAISVLAAVEMGTDVMYAIDKLRETVT